MIKFFKYNQNLVRTSFISCLTTLPQFTIKYFPIREFASNPIQQQDFTLEQMQTIKQLHALSPLDGRYYSKVSELSNYFSEYALMKYRTMVEIEWFIFFVQNIANKSIDPNTAQQVRNIYLNFDDNSALKIKQFENKTNHDLKSVEYFIKSEIKEKQINLGVSDEYFHILCTSEDINNLSYSLMIQDSVQLIVKVSLQKLQKKLEDMSLKFANISMLARTHGQPASPTTFGKELRNFSYRIEQAIQEIARIKLTGKLNGAVGNFNAHQLAYPEFDWLDVSKKFISHLNLDWNPYTTQIEPHVQISRLFHEISLINTVLIDLSRDLWTYTMFGYLKGKVIKDEVGSSTMPHKVNPIDCENAEGNLGVANSLFYHFSQKLPISRLQRDLSDSTVLRNIGVALGYSELAYKSMIKFLNKIDVNTELMQKELDQHFEILGEAVQSILRKREKEQAYEILKYATRGKGNLNYYDYQALISKIEEEGLLEKADLKLLKELNPSNYIGLAEKLAKGEYK